MSSEKMSDFFNTRASGYDNHMENNVENFELFYSKVSVPIKVSGEAINLLDLGCGTGLELKYIFNKIPNAEITAIDLSMEMLTLLQQNYAEKIDQLNLICGSYIDYPLGQNYFDYVVSVMSAHHYLEQEKVNLYAKVHSSLKDGGLYIEADFVADNNAEEEE